MKHINKLLFLLIAVLLYSCSSTNSLVNCPSFKPNKKPTPRFVKAKKPEAKKHMVKLTTKEKRVIRKEEKAIKKIEKLQTRLVNNLDIPNLKTSPAAQQKLHKILENLKTNEDKIASTADLKDWYKTEIDEKGSQKEAANKLIFGKKPNEGINIEEKLKSSDIIKQKKIKPLLQEEKPIYKKTNGLAIAGFVISLLSLLIFGIPFGLLGLIFGGVAASKIAKNPETMKGKGLAIAAIVIGIVGIVGAIVVIAALM